MFFCVQFKNNGTILKGQKYSATTKIVSLKSEYGSEYKSFKGQINEDSVGPNYVYQNYY